MGIDNKELDLIAFKYSSMDRMLFRSKGTLFSLLSVFGSEDILFLDWFSLLLVFGSKYTLLLD